MSFNYTAATRIICEDICSTLPAFSHVDMDKVGISFCQTRRQEKYGVFASLSPLKMEGGKSIKFWCGSYWKMPDVRDSSGRLILYILSLYVPRFINLTLTEKIDTIIHELYHIGEKFDGDFRRFPGRCSSHGSSRKKYDQIVHALAREWLAHDPAPEKWNFLTLNFQGLTQKYGSVGGTKFRTPHMSRLTEDEVRKLFRPY
ncbi:MAG: hypothetical protein IKW74_02705 [Thermoguttaceae bacterium]|nr:hypothetical protein [Thermoguttaceae bacterium]